jgi:ATP-dependent exoDNAse (exonuclease V) beta subunit
LSKKEHSFEAWEPPNTSLLSDFTPVDFSELSASSSSHDFEEWDPTSSSILVNELVNDIETLSQGADDPDHESVVEPVQAPEEEIDPNEIAKYSEIELQEFGEQRYLEGKADSEAQLAEKYREQEQELSELLEALALEKIDATSLEMALRELLIKSVELITRAPIKESKKGLENIIQELVKFSQSSVSDEKLICLSEADFENFDSKALKLPKNIRIKSDPALNAGDAKIEIEESTLENFYEDRLKKACFELIGK